MVEVRFPQKGGGLPDRTWRGGCRGVLDGCSFMRNETQPGKGGGGEGCKACPPEGAAGGCQTYATELAGGVVRS